MKFSNVKNLSLQKLPTSLLLFYTIYREQSRFPKENIDREIDRRIYKKGKKLVERDLDIIQDRGNNLDNYTFDFSRGLVGTTENIYRHIKPYYGTVLEQLNVFTFSELALATCHFSDLSFLYQLRDGVVKQELKKQFHSKIKSSDFGKNKVARIVKLSKIQEENQDMMIYFNSLYLCFGDTFFTSFHPFIFVREQKICGNFGSCISSDTVEEYKNLNRDVYHKDLSLAERYPKVYIKK